MKRMTAVVGALFLALVSMTSHAQTYAIGTGSQSGIYYPFGGALARVWSQNIDNFDMKVEVTAASVENTIKVVRNDMLVGVAQGNVVLDAYEGAGQFPAKMPVNVLFALYPNVLHLMVPANSPIQSLKDLKGKRVSLGAPGSGTLVSSSALLEANGVDSKSDLSAQYLNYTETTNALANRHIDAGFIVGGQGVGAVTQLALSRDIRLINISEEELAAFIAKNPAYSVYTVPEGIYNKVAAFNTVSIWNVLVVNAGMDEDLAYKMTKAAFEHIDEVRKVVNIANITSIENASRLAGVPLHPGAQKYIDEVTAK